MDEAVLCQRARNAIRGGGFRRALPIARGEDPASGRPCAVCDLPVPRDGMQFEIQFAIHENTPDFSVYHVYTGCYAAWELERTRPAS